MDDGVAPLFPVPSCVVFGRKRAIGKALPDTVTAFVGSLPMRDAPEEIADKRLEAKVVSAPQAGAFTGGSPYREAFRNGATLYPRALVLVDRVQLGRLGANPAAPLVRSHRSAQEKEPWKSAPSIEHTVEAPFLRQVLLGESILPYRFFVSFEGVVPVTDRGVVLSSTMADNAPYYAEHLAGWLRAAEAVWDSSRSTVSLSMRDQLDYNGKLASQVPAPDLRIIYSKGGSLPAAMVLRNADAIIDHRLYWAAPASDGEAYYLAAALNSETARSRAERYQSRGQFGARDFDKVMFNLPIPVFDDAVALHRELAAAGREAEEVAGMVELVEGEGFQRARRRVREALAENGIGGEVERLVAGLLGPADAA